MPDFYEVFRCVGVDEAANPPGMIIPFGGSSLVALTDAAAGVSWTSSHRDVLIDEIQNPGDIIRIRDDLHNALMQPDVDPKIRDALTPDMRWSATGSTRYLKISGRSLIGPPPATITAKPPGKSRQPDAKLRVAVVKEKPIRLAIRNLMVSDGAGQLVLHAKKPSRPDKDAAAMNAIWKPQANISFELISSDPLIVDDSDEATRKEIAGALGVKLESFQKLSEVIDPNALRDVFVKRNNVPADFTIIVVRKAIDLAKSEVNGLTIPSGAFAVVTDIRDLTTLAHEAGHFIGGHSSKGGWVDEPDWYTNDTRALMRGGGAGFKIGFDFAMQCRRFPARS